LRQADVNSLLSNLTATVAATDLGRRNPSLVKGIVNDYYYIAIRIRQEQDEVIPLELYLSIEVRLAEEGIGPGLAHDLVAAIVNRSAQMKGNVERFSWDDIRPLLEEVRNHIKNNGVAQETEVRAVLARSDIKHAANWVKNYADSQVALNSTPLPPSSPSPTPESTLVISRPGHLRR
jgi:hypothetical protein